METLVRDLTLRSGEDARVWKITGPEPAWADRILPFLGHKGADWHWPMRDALASGLPPLTMNFHECTIGDEVVGNMTTLEGLNRPIGLLQHVFTPPEHRQKGIADALMRAMTDDFAARGGRSMYLGTGNPVAVRLYEKYGFAGVQGTGFMQWFPDPDLLTTYFSPGPVSVREINWGDWPLLAALYAIEDGWTLRSLWHGLYGFENYEHPFVDLKKDLRDGRAESALVLAKDDGAVVGHAFLWPRPHFPDGPYMLEFFVHPNFYDQAGLLLSSLEIPAGRKLQCACDNEARERQAILDRSDLWREATLRNQFRHDGRWFDLHLYSSRWVPSY
jgi:GNAT superfamily N-acetyltransferase